MASTQDLGTSAKKTRGGQYCVAGWPNSKICTNSQHTGMRRFPMKDKEKLNKWTAFMRRHRPKFVPQQYSVLCSMHFADSAFTVNAEVLLIPIFISDHHKGIEKWIRTSEKETQHFNDLWHVYKGLSKKILNASKEKGCELLVFWIKGIRTHLYWSAMSTKLGYGYMILAKWKSVVRHSTNKHENHPDELFPRSAHDELDDRLRFQVGMH